MKKIISAIVLVILFPLNAFAAPYLLPLGNSITEGWPPEKFPGAYRGYLQEALGVDAYDFIGPFSSGVGTMDSDHAGVAGEETGSILNRLRGYMINELSGAPIGSVILIHAGTNDMNNGANVDGAFENIRQMIDVIAQSDSGIDIYLGTIVPIIGGGDSAVQSLNDKIRQYVAGSSLAQLHLVDHYNAFVANGQWSSALMDDTVHPNAAGLELMSRTWATALGQNVTTATQTAAQNTAQTTTQQTTTQNQQVTQLTQTTTLPQNCAASFDTQKVRNPLLVSARNMQMQCAHGIIFTTGTTQTYTYKTAYVTIDSDNFTQSVTLTGATDSSGQWIIGPAQGIVPSNAHNQPNYIAVYSCQKEGNIFRCGCTGDGKCSQPTTGVFQWFVQKFIPIVEK